MTGEVGAHTNRPELVTIHGYDTKYAMHALRLGIQGVELLSTGRITLPVPEPQLGLLQSVSRGEVPLSGALKHIDEARDQLLRLRADSYLPPEPDLGWVNGWLHRSYQAYWSPLTAV